MTKRAKIRTRFSTEINAAAARFRDHEMMNRDKVLQWIEQFDDCDLECGIKVLQNIRYYSAPKIRRLLEDLVGLAYKSLRGVPRNRIYFVPVGRLVGGASVVARALADTPGVRRSQIIHMLELEKLQPEKIGGIVFLEDFSGTGKTLAEWWSTVEMMVRPKNARFVVAVLVLSDAAREKIREFAQELIGGESLSENDNSLSTLSTMFTDPEKDSLIVYCGRTGTTDEYRRGFGNCGLLVAFRHGCPNNSLPILWHGSRTWRALFQRRSM